MGNDTYVHVLNDRSRDKWKHMCRLDDVIKMDLKSFGTEQAEEL